MRVVDDTKGRGGDGNRPRRDHDAFLRLHDVHNQLLWRIARRIAVKAVACACAWVGEGEERGGVMKTTTQKARDDALRCTMVKRTEPLSA